jgi:hypothetical protein
MNVDSGMPVVPQATAQSTKATVRRTFVRPLPELMLSRTMATLIRGTKTNETISAARLSLGVRGPSP